MRTTIVIPTYNERENIGDLLDALLELPVPDLSLLVVDDSSPDGTGDVVRARAATDPRIHLQSYPRKAGLGRAYTAAFSLLLFREARPAPGSRSVSVAAKADAGDAPEGPTTRTDAEGPLPGGPAGGGAASDARGIGADRRQWEDPVRQDPHPRGTRGGPGSPWQGPPPPPEVIVQMDADFSHDPADVPRLLAALEDADVAVGSRYVRGGGIRNWSLLRRMLSRGANAYARVLTGAPILDLTGGFNAWRSSTLAAVDPASIHADGYGYLIALKVHAARLGTRIAEVPIVFTERRAGASKLSRRVIGEAALLVLRLRSARRPPAPRPPVAATPEPVATRTR